PLTAYGLLGYLSTNTLDAFFILKLRSPADLGLYTVAYQLAGAFMQLAAIAGSLLLSFFVTLGLEGKSERTSRYFREMLPALALLWSAACIAFAAVSSVLIPVFFGPSFSGSSPLVWPLSAAAALAGPVFLGFGPLVNARSATFISTCLAAASASVNVLLNALLIPRFGLAGCAWATAAAYAASTLVAVALSRKLVDTSFRWNLLPAAPAVVAAAVAAGGEPFLAATAGAAALLAIAFARRREVKGSLLRLARLAMGERTEGAGERFVPGRGRDAWRGIHVARYCFAAPYVRAERVLDVACGSGYGLPVLEAVAADVVGVDLDDAALRKARGSASMSALLSAEASRLPFTDGVFGVVTSFETLEHLERRREFVLELRRVLRSDGVLILSTPNAEVTEPVDGRPRNPHHLHEYRPSELKAELESSFGEVAILGQVLDSRFRISPFRDDQRKLPKTFGVQARLLLWRILYKLPEAPRDALGRFFLGHPLIAGEADFQFRPDAVERAPVLVALCRGYARGAS
ncbi:MAG TPA: methyltransferase domain-containing protein, partial [Vicinamibacteria bacterium]